MGEFDLLGNDLDCNGNNSDFVGGLRTIHQLLPWFTAVKLSIEH